MMTTEKTMTFEHAVKVVKNYGEGDLLKGLEGIRYELDNMEDGEDHPVWVTQVELAAYRLVVAKMRPLFA